MTKKKQKPKTGRYSSDVNEMSAFALGKELVQIKIDHECGPGDVHRRFIVEREKDIHRELARRTSLQEEALREEVAARDALAKEVSPQFVVRLFDDMTEKCNALGQQMSMHVGQVVNDTIKLLEDREPNASMRDLETLFISHVQMATARKIVMRRRPG